jgi:hypothetical protein
MPRYLQAHNEAQEGFTPQDVTSICNAAKAAWDKASARARCVQFRWRGKRYQSRMTNFRLLVQTLAGDAVACRWH